MPTALPFESLNPCGITLVKRLDDILYVVRSSLLEKYKILNEGTEFKFLSSNKFSSKVLFVDRYQDELLIGLDKTLLLVEPVTYKELKLYETAAPNEHYQLIQNTKYCYCKHQKIVITANDENTITFVHLAWQKSHSIPFRSGKILDLNAYNEYFAILAEINPVDSGTVLNNFKNFRSTYCMIFSTQNDKVVEVEKLTQLPYDSYKLVSGPGGFIIVSPREFVFKNFKENDIRLRFSRHPEENEIKMNDELINYLKLFNDEINFDFSNLLKCKHYYLMEDNIIKENELITTVDEYNVLEVNKELIPGCPCLYAKDQFKYYGYDQQEINLKANQIINIVGDYPVFDYTLECELGNISNQKYIGMRANIQNFFEITPIYTCEIVFLTESVLLVANCQEGLFYSIMLDQQNANNIIMLPVIEVDKNQPLWNEGVINAMCPLHDSTLVDRDFLDHERQVNVFNVLLASSVGDSFVNQFEITFNQPGKGYYNDYRVKCDDFNDDDFRQELYNELKNACDIINKSVDKEEQNQQAIIDGSHVEEVDFAGTKFKLNEAIRQRIFGSELKPFEMSNILEINKTSINDNYSNHMHMTTKPIGLIPSYSGVVDAVVESKRHSTYINNNLHLLHYGGCLENIKQTINVEGNEKLNHGFDDEIETIYKIRETGDAMYVMCVKKYSAEVLKIIYTERQVQITDKHEMMDLNFKNDTIVRVFSGDDLIIITTRQILFYKGLAKKATKFDLERMANGQPGLALSADVIVTKSGQYLVQVAFAQYIIIFNIQECQIITIDPELFVNNNEMTITAAQSFDPRQSGLAELYGSELQMVTTVITDESYVLVFGLDELSKPVLLSAFSPFKREADKISFSDYIQIHCENVEKKVGGLVGYEDIGRNEDLQPLEFSELAFFKVNVLNGAEYNTYMFATIKGGGVFAYMLENEERGKPIFKQIANLSGQISFTKKLEDRWACVFAHQKEDYRVIESQFVTSFVCDGAESIFIGYPMPANQIEPASYVAVPTFNGALSFYQLGRHPSKVRAGKGKTIEAMVSCNVPLRFIVQRATGSFVALADFEIMQPKEFIKTENNGVLHHFQYLNFGSVRSSLADVPLHKALACFPQMPLTEYFASFNQNGLNGGRHMLMLPFCCQRVAYHQKSSTFLVTSLTPRYEIRPYHSVTKDEVANIRIFDIVDQSQSNRQYLTSDEELKEFCHKLLPRDPAPFNSHSVINHEHIFLVDQGQILDHQAVEFNKTEHINTISCDLMYSNYPRFYTKTWQSAYQTHDEYGRVDRRRKNDERQKRQEILQKHEQIQETRELVFVGTGYLMGCFNKQYGKIYMYCVESVDEMRRHGAERAAPTGRNARLPTGAQRFQLNVIAQEEFQNAVTAVAVQPVSRCVLIAQAKLINGYLFTDGQKLEKCHSTAGFVYITQMARFQDFLLVNDQFYDTKLFVWRDRGKRLTEFGARSLDSQVFAVEFLVNQYEEELLMCYQFAGQLGIYNYKPDDPKFDGRLALDQLVLTPETPMRLIKTVTAQPEPNNNLKSSICCLDVDLHGGILQLIPLPEKIFQLVGTAKSFIDVGGDFKVFNNNQVVGSILSNQYDGISDFDKLKIECKARGCRGVW